MERQLFISLMKYLINEKNIKPCEILVISFTNKSVNDLKRKINYEIDIMTFHKLAMSILDKKHTQYSLVSDNYLEYVTDEFFKSINSKKKDKLLKYFKAYNYDKFLESYNFRELKKLIITLIKLYKTNNKTKDDLKKLFL